VRWLPWLILIVFPTAICSFPLVTCWHFLTTACHIWFLGTALSKKLA
jgi:hypothetical protein